MSSHNIFPNLALLSEAETGQLAYHVYFIFFFLFMLLVPS